MKIYLEGSVEEIEQFLYGEGEAEEECKCKCGSEMTPEDEQALKKWAIENALAFGKFMEAFKPQG